MPAQSTQPHSRFEAHGKQKWRCHRVHSPAALHTRSSANASDPPSCASKKFASHVECDLGEKNVGRNDHDVGNDHGLSGSTPDALRTAAHVQPLIASDGRENEPID